MAAVSDHMQSLTQGPVRPDPCVHAPVCLRGSLVGVPTRRIPADAGAVALSIALALRDVAPWLENLLDGTLGMGVVIGEGDSALDMDDSAGEEGEGARNGAATELEKFCRARPSSTLRAREANSRELLVSEELSPAGETLTTMRVLLLPPRESSRRRVSCAEKEGVAMGCGQTKYG